jgi:hypothetical protein
VYAKVHFIGKMNAYPLPVRRHQYTPLSFQRVDMPRWASRRIWERLGSVSDSAGSNRLVRVGLPGLVVRDLNSQRSTTMHLPILTIVDMRHMRPFRADVL